MFSTINGALSSSKGVEDLKGRLLRQKLALGADVIVGLALATLAILGAAGVNIPHLNTTGEMQGVLAGAAVVYLAWTLCRVVQHYKALRTEKSVLTQPKYDVWIACASAVLAIAMISIAATASIPEGWKGMIYGGGFVTLGIAGLPVARHLHAKLKKKEDDARAASNPPPTPLANPAQNYGSRESDVHEPAPVRLGSTETGDGFIEETD